MKHVVSRAQVAHLWANQSQEHARNSSKSFYFRDKTIYSYGGHFPIARHIDLNNLLLTTRTYSNTTANHISQTRRAIHPSDKIIMVDNPSADSESEHKRNLKDLRTNFDTAIQKAGKAVRYTSMYINQATALGATHCRYRTLFGLELDTVLEFDPIVLNTLNAKIIRQNVNETKRDERQAQLRLKRVEQYKVVYENWKQGANVSTYNFYNLPIALRVSHDGTNIETTNGADVPVEHAKRCWSLVNRIKDSGRAYQKNGHSEHVGAFVVNYITVEGDMQIGCHYITYTTMSELAAKLGW